MASRGEPVSGRRAALVLLCSVAARPLAAQVQRHLQVDAALGRAQFQSTTSGGTQELTGFLVGGRARLIVGVASLEASYAQGRLSADTGSAPARDVVDGSVFLSVKPATWLSLQAGPEVRAYATPGGTERWVMWQGRLFVESPIIPGVLSAGAGGWTTLASAVNVDPGASGARGGEVRMTLRPPRLPLMVRLSYAVDQALMRNGAGTEVLETVVLSIGFGGR